jgi:hypothetical protein
MRPLAGGVANARPSANGWLASGLPALSWYSAMFD